MSSRRQAQHSPASQRLETATFEAKALETLIQEFAQAEGVKLNDIN